jgi:hypothetical protein
MVYTHDEVENLFYKTGAEFEVLVPARKGKQPKAPSKVRAFKGVLEIA